MRTNIISVALSVAALLLASCGFLGGDKLTAKFNGKESAIEPKSTWAYHSTKTFSYPEGGQTVMTKSSINTFVIANYDMDTRPGFNSINNSIKSAEQARVLFSITGEKDTEVKSPVKAGTYASRTNARDYFNKN